MKSYKNYLSIDIGGTKILIIIYSSIFKILRKKIYKTSSVFVKKDISDLSNLFSTIANKFGNDFKRVGISFNCAINNNWIFYSSLLGGQVSLNIKNFSAKYFNFEEFVSDNDVVCMAKAENLFGYGKKYKNFVYVNLGTGIRVAAVESGKILRGYKNLAGEISTLKIWVEEINRSLEADEMMAGKGLKNLSLILENKGVNINKVYFKNKNNTKIINLYSKYLANLFIIISQFYNPEIIVLGGSITKSYKYWFNKLKQYYYLNCRSIFLVKDIFISQIKYSASLGAILTEQLPKHFAF